MSHPCPITRPIFEKHTTPYEPMQSFVCPVFVYLTKFYWLKMYMARHEACRLEC